MQLVFVALQQKGTGIKSLPDVLCSHYTIHMWAFSWYSSFENMVVWSIGNPKMNLCVNVYLCT